MSPAKINKKVIEQIKNLPHAPGVYLFKDNRGEVIYVGKAKDLINRVRNYIREGP